MFGPVLRKGTIRDQPGFAGGDWQSRGRPGWRASPSRNIRTRWGMQQSADQRPRHPRQRILPVMRYLDAANRYRSASRMPDSAHS